MEKVTKSKTIFPTNDFLFKALYWAMMNITKKRTGKAWSWGQTLNQPCIYFVNRIKPEDIILKTNVKPKIFHQFKSFTQNKLHYHSSILV